MPSPSHIEVRSDDVLRFDDPASSHQSVRARASTLAPYVLRIATRCHSRQLNLPDCSTVREENALACPTLPRRFAARATSFERPQKVEERRRLPVEFGVEPR